MLCPEVFPHHLDGSLRRAALLIVMRIDGVDTPLLTASQCAKVVRAIPQPVRFTGVEERPDTCVPCVGADTDWVPGELGFSQPDIDSLRAAGVLRT